MFAKVQRESELAPGPTALGARLGLLWHPGLSTPNPLPPGGLSHSYGWHLENICQNLGLSSKAWHHRGPGAWCKISQDGFLDIVVSE